MNANKRLNKLESQLIKSDDTDLNVIMIDFVRPGQLDAKITHLWSQEGIDDCYLEANESDDGFLDRALNHITGSSNTNDKNLIMIFGNTEVMDTEGR